MCLREVTFEETTSILMNEFERRDRLWREVQKFPLAEVSPSYIRKKYIYRGQAGIYTNKEITSSLTADSSGVAVSILHTGKHYPDELTSDGMIYHYPKTNRPKSHDINEIIATKNAEHLGLPIFVILPGKVGSLREVKLGWVIDYDDKAEVFLIDFSKDKPPYDYRKKDEPFQLILKGHGNTTRTKTRPNQHKFQFDVYKNYGCKCAVCDITIKDILDAAHIRGKKDNGSDDWRNGILLCKNHHKSFDSGLFKIDPISLEIKFSEKVNKNEIKISEKRLVTATGKTPHIDALTWKWKNEKLN